MSVPLPTTGISGGISETGAATVEVPLYVETLGEALTVLPNLGIGIAAPAAMQFPLRVGCWRCRAVRSIPLACLYAGGRWRLQSDAALRGHDR